MKYSVMRWLVLFSLVARRLILSTYGTIFGPILFNLTATAASQTTSPSFPPSPPRLEPPPTVSSLMTDRATSNPTIFVISCGTSISGFGRANVLTPLPDCVFMQSQAGGIPIMLLTYSFNYCFGSAGRQEWLSWVSL